MYLDTMGCLRSNILTNHWIAPLCQSGWKIAIRTWINVVEFVAIATNPQNTAWARQMAVKATFATVPTISLLRHPKQPVLVPMDVWFRRTSLREWAEHLLSLPPAPGRLFRPWTYSEKMAGITWVANTIGNTSCGICWCFPGLEWTTHFQPFATLTA